MQARDIMTDRVTSVRPDDFVEKAISITPYDRISGLPVLDEKGSLAGIVTEGDFLRRSEIGTQIKRSRRLGFVLDPGRLAEKYAHARARRVENVMTVDVHTASETSPLGNIVEITVQKASSVFRSFATTA